MTPDDQRRALLQRIEELTCSPTLVHLIDHRVERLLALEAAD